MYGRPNGHKSKFFRLDGLLLFCVIMLRAPLLWQWFKEAKNDLKLIWRLINETINKRKRKPSLPSSFDTEGRTVTNPKEIAGNFLKHFYNLGPNLAKALPTVNYSFRSIFSDNNNTPLISNSVLKMLLDVFVCSIAEYFNELVRRVNIQRTSKNTDVVRNLSSDLHNRTCY